MSMLISQSVHNILCIEVYMCMFCLFICFGFFMYLQGKKKMKTDQEKFENQTVDEHVMLTFIIINVFFVWI